MNIDKLIEVLTKIREQNPESEVFVREDNYCYMNNLVSVEVVNKKIQYFNDDDVEKEKELSCVLLVFEDETMDHDYEDEL